MTTSEIRFRFGRRISNAMNLMSVNAYLQQVVMGLIIIMAILFDMVRKGYIFRKPDEE